MSSIFRSASPRFIESFFSFRNLFSKLWFRSLEECFLYFSWITFLCLLVFQHHADYDTESFILHDAEKFSASAEAENELQHRGASWLEFELAHDHRERQANNAELEAGVFARNLAMDCAAG